MNESDIYAMARKAGAATDVGTGEWLMTFEELVSFAYTLIAHEREECAKVVEESSLPDVYSEPALLDIAAAIRARGQE